MKTRGQMAMNISGEADRKPRELWSVGSALRVGAAMLARAGGESARLDAGVLLAEALEARREDLYIHSTRALTVEQRDLYEKWLGRRVLGEPVAYIVGRREFWSLDFSVCRDVLIPRPETELLVELVLARAPAATASGRGFRVLDLGTGSGAIAVSLAKERVDLVLWATDFSPTAVDTARANARRHCVEPRIHFFQGDLFEPIADREGFFDVIVSNPPYISRPEIAGLPRDVRDWEPRMALDGGMDGLDFYRRIAAEAHLYLKDGGFVLLESGPQSAAQVCDLFTASGSYEGCAVHSDYSGRPRAISARKLSQV